MSEEKYPADKPSRHKTVRIASGLHQAIEEFLKTPMAMRMGYHHKSDVVTDAVRHLLISYNFYLKYEPKEKRR